VALREVLPERNIRVPETPDATCQGGAASSSSGRPPDAQRQGGAASSSSECDEEATSQDDEDAGEQIMNSKAWSFPKAHAMYHATTTIRLYGSLDSSSCEALERRHGDIKAAFTRTNNKEGCELQVLREEMRKDHSSNERPCGESLDEGDTDIVHSGMKRLRPLDAGGASAAASGPARVNASFSDDLHSSARRFPVWKLMLNWRQCRRQLKYRATMSQVTTAGGNPSHAKVNIPMRALHDGTSQWRQNSSDMKHLPAELARYVRDHFSEHWDKGIFPEPDGEALSPEQIFNLCSMVQQCASRADREAVQTQGPAEAHLEGFNGLEITHPQVSDQVNCVCKATRIVSSCRCTTRIVVFSRKYTCCM